MDLFWFENFKVILAVPQKMECADKTQCNAEIDMPYEQCLYDGPFKFIIDLYRQNETQNSCY